MARQDVVDTGVLGSLDVERLHREHRRMEEIDDTGDHRRHPEDHGGASEGPPRAILCHGASALPEKLSLRGNYPNPFNPSASMIRPAESPTGLRNTLPALYTAAG